MNSTDHIERQILLKAPRERVWRALTDPAQFGAWFGMAFDGPFIAGQPVSGRIEPTQVDAEVAKMQEKFRGTPITLLIERIEPMRLFSYRWHPYAVDTTVDYSDEPTTLVSFELEEAYDGTLLRLTESGFDALPAARRENALRANRGGWKKQISNIQRYVDAH
ncbi:SRPBCC family protein [Oleiagrimonas sp. C23AA]|uniref:SRPBCC family protein n=1 Tax=Oleiagrimonas sp. C23AA TaxID=2719047 RepID=UPI00141E53D7|nr:SRPBCC family protein [Oleiagrimonas sp. C23AA]NII09689.1 vanillate O-demethylase oxidoreductase VanB [Oleiagrimonas sp. C23AA]